MQLDRSSINDITSDSFYSNINENNTAIPFITYSKDSKGK